MNKFIYNFIILEKNFTLISQQTNYTRVNQNAEHGGILQCE